MTQKRKNEISYLNVLLCIFVILIHIISFAVSGFEYGTLSYNLAMFPWRMVSFVVQGFILLSGVKMFLTHKDEVSYGRYLRLRLRGVILPYAVSYLVYYICYMFFYDYPADPVFFLKHLVLGSLVCHFYFIPLLFQFDLLQPLWKRVINNVSPLLVIPFTLIISAIFEVSLPSMISNIFPNVSFIYNDRIFTTYLVYWVIGCYIGKYYEEFSEILKKNFRAICVIFGICFILFAHNTYLAYNGLKYVPSMNHIHSLYVLWVIIFLYALFMKLPENMPNFIRMLDGISYDIYLWHMLFVLLSGFVIEKLGIQSQLLAFIIRAFFAYGFTVAACIGLKKLRVLFGKRNLKKEIS